MLKGYGLCKNFGGVAALNHVDISLEKGSLVGLIGPNGAGKTTLFNAIAGAFPLSSGTLEFNGQPLRGRSANEICRLGIARTFQVPRPFAEMTCLENVLVPLVNRPLGGDRSVLLEEAREALAFVGLDHRDNTPAKELNLVEKKQLEMARALSTNPKLLLLDEVLGGLNTQEIGAAVELIASLSQGRGITVLWIEHVMGAIMGAAERVIVLDQGEKLMEGTPEEVAHDPRVIHAYLGT
ncbi:MAG: ABC transporter ATP-binding protein [Deltaproteobacteria bacterium]|nr:ABC transporter ATP-binding protein [Candidatus Anaeroferrophillus wilburensis]MBN2889007.1 ABC transporter ATP-binding protein [Deltaproteobacteria bacterium]